MKTLLLSLTSSAIVGLSSAAMANLQPPLNQATPLQQYSSADSDTNDSTGASNATESPPIANDASPAAPEAAPEAPVPATALPATSTPPNAKDQTAQNAPFDPTYDEDQPSSESQSGQ